LRESIYNDEMRASGKAVASGSYETIFSTKALDLIAKHLPETVDEVAQIEGIGKKRAAKYGTRLVIAVLDFCEKYPDLFPRRLKPDGDDDDTSAKSKDDDVVVVAKQQPAPVQRQLKQTTLKLPSTQPQPQIQQQQPQLQQQHQQLQQQRPALKLPTLPSGFLGKRAQPDSSSTSTGSTAQPTANKKLKTDFSQFYYGGMKNQ